MANENGRERQAMEERLRQLFAELEAMAQLPPDERDALRWRQLALEQAELLHVLRPRS